jgi:glucose-6-phosphate isomerase
MLPHTQRPAWLVLDTHYQNIKDFHLRQLFVDEPQRGTRLSI